MMAMSRMDREILRLDEAAELLFPDECDTKEGRKRCVARLRRERDKGRLAVTEIGGKEYTTLAAIRDMIQLCRVQPNQSASSSTQPKAAREPSGTFTMARPVSPHAAAKAKLQALKQGLPNTSPPNTNPRAENVVPLKSPSLM